MCTELFQLQPAEEISVISLWQPWAQWVMLGWKPIETRLHERFRGLKGKTIGIHAAQHWDSFAKYAACRSMTEDKWKQTISLRVPGGHLLGTVDVVDSRALTPADSIAAMIECMTKRFGLVLENPKSFENPIPMRGRQGIWKHRICTTNEAHEST